MAVEVVGSLKPGVVASLLEILALVLGMLIVANMGAIAGLSARRKLYSRGTAKLRDATWNVGLVEAIGQPRRALRDPRRGAAALLALAIIALEALAVLDLGQGEACVYDGPATWDVRTGAQRCFVRSAALRSSELFGAEALEKVADVDVGVGMPIMTDVFEESVVAPAAVGEVGGEVASAEVKRTFGVDGELVYAGTSVSVLRRTFVESLDGRCSVVEPEASAPLDLEVVPRTDVSGRDAFFSEGLMLAVPCDEEMEVYICRHARTEFDGEEAVSLNVSCEAVVLDRDGRRPGAGLLVLLTVLGDAVDVPSVRKALLATIVAENSASNEPCDRAVAVPKSCTRIGSVSLIAVALLGAIFVASAVWRIVLSYLARPTVDWNSDYEHLIKSVFEHFDNTGHGGAPGRARGDVHVSVLSSGLERGLHHVAWTREPVDMPPSKCVERSLMISNRRGSPESEDDERDMI